MTLRSQGGIKALLGIVRCGHPDVLSQVARGIANFAKCESRASNQGLLSSSLVFDSKSENVQCKCQIGYKMNIVVTKKLSPKCR